MDEGRRVGQADVDIAAERCRLVLEKVQRQRELIEAMATGASPEVVAAARAARENAELAERSFNEAHPPEPGA